MSSALIRQTMIQSFLGGFGFRSGAIFFNARPKAFFILHPDILGIFDKPPRLLAIIGLRWLAHMAST
jgi:hypothetical protein